MTIIDTLKQIYTNKVVAVTMSGHAYLSAKKVVNIIFDESSDGILLVYEDHTKALVRLNYNLEIIE